MFFYLAMLYQALKVILLKPFRKDRRVLPYERIPMAMTSASADIPDTVEPEPTLPYRYPPTGDGAAIVYDFTSLDVAPDKTLPSWRKSDWGAPGFTPDHHTGFADWLVQTAPDALDLVVHQYIGSDKGEEHDGHCSLGAEIKSKDLFSYGTYEFIVQMGNFTGKAVTGSVSCIQILTRVPPTSQDLHATDIRIEVLGDSPDELYLSSSATTCEAVEAETNVIPFGTTADNFHKFQIVWEKGQITFWVDDVPVAVHHKNVPFTPGKVCFSHYGSDGEWGGKAAQQDGEDQ